MHLEDKQSQDERNKAQKTLTRKKTNTKKGTYNNTCICKTEYVYVQYNCSTNMIEILTTALTLNMLVNISDSVLYI